MIYNNIYNIDKNTNILRNFFLGVCIPFSEIYTFEIIYIIFSFLKYVVQIWFDPVSLFDFHYFTQVFWFTQMKETKFKYT